jgi:streptogramin lyase
LRPLLLLLIVAGLAGCSSRDRANPFDPNNPDTRGGPAGFAALADNGWIELVWNPVPGTALSGFRLYRKTEIDLVYRVIAELPPTASRFSDVGLLNGLRHGYRLVFLFPEGERGTPAEDFATPGPVRPWVVDGSLGAVLRVTPDARHVAYSRGGFVFPVAVAADPVSGSVWISDNGAGSVSVLNPWTGSILTTPGLVGPSSVAVDPSDHRAWVCDESDRTLYHFESSGALVGTPIEPIETPLGVTIDPVDRSVWVAERGGNRLRHYSPDHVLLGSVTVDRPSRVAVDSVTRAVWVTSFENGQVLRVTPAGVVDRTFSGYRGPIGIAIDPRRGRIWVADALANEVVLLDRAGNVITRAPGIAETRDVAIDLTTGEAWAVAPAAGEVVRISPGGAVMLRLGNLRRPVGISVDPGVR